MTTLADPTWYVVQTHVHSEAKAASHLVRQGFSTYLPRYLKRRRHARKIETVPVPLFPRYLFVSIDRATQGWRSIHSTIGVSRLVCIGDEPAPVPFGVISDLRQREGADGLISLNFTPRFTTGDKIRVLDGLFTGCLGLFQGTTDQERVAVLLDMLGRKTRVVLDGESVTAA